MSRVNINNVSDHISEDDKRKIRQRCGFGCVRCGFFIYQYDHFSPEFTKVTDKNPDGITLLCGGCHDMVTRKFLSRQEVAACNSNPRCKQDGYANSKMFRSSAFSGYEPKVVMGTCIIRATKVFAFEDKTILAFSPPEEPGAPIQLDMALTDRSGRDLLAISKNELRVDADRFDITATAGVLRVHGKDNETLLRMHLDTTQGVLIEEAHLLLGKSRVDTDGGPFVLSHPTGITMTVSEGISADIAVWERASGDVIVASDWLGEGKFIIPAIRATQPTPAD